MATGFVSGGRGRRRAGEPVLLNVYDLSPQNDYLAGLGLGAYHSGLVVHGQEYTFSNDGVFSHTPGAAGGAKLRETVTLGATQLSQRDVEARVDSLKDKFAPGSYHVIKQNCNCFSDALAQALLQVRIPGWVNRMADIGNYFSCLFPDQGMHDAPVSRGEQPGSTAAGPGLRLKREAFAGSGHALSGAGASNGGENGGGEAETSSLLGGFLGGGGGGGDNRSGGTAGGGGPAAGGAAERRRRALEAAMARRRGTEQG